MGLAMFSALSILKSLPIGNTQTTPGAGGKDEGNGVLVDLATVPASHDRLRDGE
jgi:hypothetical protein